MTSQQQTSDIHKPTRFRKLHTKDYRRIPGEHYHGAIVIRYDDHCGNGQNTFHIEVLNKKGGQMYLAPDVLRKVFPEYAHLRRWRFFSTDGPMHYLKNTLYFAGDNKEKAQRSLLKAQKGLEAFQEEYAHLPCGKYAEDYVKGLRSCEAAVSIAEARLAKAEGPDLESARRSAIAPDATLEQLQDEEWLKARLPGLIEEFKRDMEQAFQNYQDS